MDGPSEYQIAYIIGLGTIGMLILVVAIILFVIFYQKRVLQVQLEQERMEAEYQQKMLQAALESQENERKRLAADLHDGVGSMLSTIRLSLSTSAQHEGNFKENVMQMKSMLDDTIESVRKLSRDLLPSTLEKFGLSNAVKEMCEQYSSISGLPITLSETGNPRQLEKTNEVMVFRIIQELINNAMKHAQASTINVVLDWRNSLEVQVSDDGIGFTPDTRNSGLGLFNMQNRTKLLNATLHFGQNHPTGSAIVLTLPEPA